MMGKCQKPKRETETRDRLMVNGKSGGVQSSKKKQESQTERLVSMTHLGGDRQKWLLIHT